MDLTSQEPALLDFFCERACISMCVQGRNQQQAMEGRGRAECIHCGRRCKGLPRGAAWGRGRMRQGLLEERRGVGGGCGRVSWSGGAASRKVGGGCGGAASRRIGSGYPITQSAIHYLTLDFFWASPLDFYTRF